MNNPDFKRLRRAIEHKESDRVPLVELLVNVEIKEAFSEYVIQPNMAVAIDVHAYGYPKFPGMRYEEVFIITKDGKKHLSKCPRYA